MLFGKKSKKVDGHLKGCWTAAVPDYVIDVALSANGELAAAAASGPIVVSNARTGEVLTTLSGHGFGTTAIEFGPSNGELVSVGQDGKVRFWDIATGTPRVTGDGGAAWVEHLAWHPSGHVLAIAAGKRVRFWKPTGELYFETCDHSSTIADIAWRPGRRELSVASYGNITLWDLGDVSEELPQPSNIETPEPLDFKGSMLKQAWSPSGQYLAVGTQEATVMYWDYGKLDQPALNMAGFETKVRQLSWHSAGKWLATGGGNSGAIWDCSGKGPRGRQPMMLDVHQEHLTQLKFQHNGTLIATAGEDGLLTIWTAPSFIDPLDEFDFFAPITALEWSRCDELLFVGSDSGAVAMFAIE